LTVTLKARDVTASRRRALVPERLLLPPPPRSPELRARWEALPFERRRRLALASHRGVGNLDEDDEPLVRELARARVATAWRLQVAAVVFGWLMLMTLWGFGRSTYPEQVGWWLAAGLGAGGVVWLVAARAALARTRGARRVADRGP
jgi:hypothetical protein